MHYHLEIIMPPTDNIEISIKEILTPFLEGSSNEDGYPNLNTFYDYYTIGGRWSGIKLEYKLGTERIKEFRTLLAKKGVTVSGIRWGKEELSPKSQIPMVDRLWQEFSPDSGVKTCPLFKSFDGCGSGDVMTLKDLPRGLTASRVIIAASPHGSLEAVYMIQDSMWNGVTHVDIEWDGEVETVISKHIKTISTYNPDYIEKTTPKEDWIIVTVDCHN